MKSQYDSSVSGIQKTQQDQDGGRLKEGTEN